MVAVGTLLLVSVTTAPLALRLIAELTLLQLSCAKPGTANNAAKTPVKQEIKTTDNKVAAIEVK